ncbi:hypothetical protein IJ182_10050 [bacterium]|nr:hypothetical protein [bacterium]
MSRGSIRYIDSTYIYGQHAAVAAPVTNPVIYGRFPKHNQKKSYADKLNKFLSAILLMLVVLSLVSYYFVSDSEKNMNKLGREIVALSNENIELQNRLDNLHSFNKIDSIITNNSALDTAKNVIEVSAVNMVNAPQAKPAPVNYTWSIGY